MKLLKDDELVAVITKDPSIFVKGFVTPANWFDDKSPVQASSLDLHIGSIFLPGPQESAAAGQLEDKPYHCLEAGGTAVVLTREVLKLPKDIAGIGFPKSKVSFKGILMTNPGHVDPGYEGPLRFTLINMGKEGYPLNIGGVIITLLLFQFSSPVQKGYYERVNKVGGLPSLTDVNLLTRDFLEVEKRAKHIARKAVMRASLWSTLIAAGITGAAAVFVSTFAPWHTDVDKANDRITVLERASDTEKQASTINTLREEVDSLKRDVSSLQARLTNQPAPASDTQPGQPQK